MKEILKTTEHYRVEKWINSNTYAVKFFDELRYIDGTFNKNYIEKNGVIYADGERWGDAGLFKYLLNIGVLR